MKTSIGQFFFAAILSCNIAIGASFQVTTTADSGEGSLREAIQSANSNPDGDDILLNVTGTIELSSALPAIVNTVAIIGPGADQLTVRRSAALGTPDFRVFEFAAPLSSLSGVRISGGAAPQGAGILNTAELVVSDCVISGNIGRGAGRGAGIRNDGNLQIVRCVVSGNFGSNAAFDGGGISTGAGELILTDSTVSGNRVGDEGGGIHADAGGSEGYSEASGVVLERSTVSGNVASGNGGGLRINGSSSYPVSIINSTFSANFSSGIGGAIHSDGGVTRLISTTIVSNTAASRAGGIYILGSEGAEVGNTIIARNRNNLSPDVDAGTADAIASLGNNLVGAGSANAPFANGVNGDIVGSSGTPVDPLIGPLAANLGPTFTHALLAGSPAIDAGGDQDNPETDQRGLPRVQGAAIDIGAFESAPLTDGVPPQIASATILCAEDSGGLIRVFVEFSEALQAETALNVGSYSFPDRNVIAVTEVPDTFGYLLEVDSPFLCGFSYLLTVAGVVDLSGEPIGTATTNLATASLPCCNNTYALNLPTGWSLVANQLDRGFNRLPDLLPAVPEGSIVKTLKSPESGAAGVDLLGFPNELLFDTYTFSAGGWSGEPVLNPGTGFFFFVPVPTNIVMRGALPVVNLPVPFPTHPQLLGRQTFAAGGFQDVFGTAPVEGMAVYTHVPQSEPAPAQGPNYVRRLFRNGVWDGGAPFAKVGEAWLVQRIEPVVITTNPASQFDVQFGSAISFHVAATGTPPLRYQWRHNGINLPGETNATLNIASVQLSDGGSYSVAVENPFNAVESASAELSLLIFDLPNLPLTNNFADRVVLTDPSGLGNSNNFGSDKEPGEPNHAGKAGGKSMWIDWQAPANGIVQFATTGSSFDTLLAAYAQGNPPMLDSLVEVASDEEAGGFLTSKITFNVQAGQIYSIAVDGFGAAEGIIVLGWEFEETAEALPFVLQTPASIVAALGDTIIFSTLAQGSNIRYQWFFNGNPLTPPRQVLPGPGDNYRIAFARAEDAGQYFVRIFNGNRFVDSQPISLQFNMEGLAKTVRQVLTADKLLDALVIIQDPLAGGLAGAPGGKPPAAFASASATVQRSFIGTQIFNTYGAVKQPGEPNHCGIPGGASQWFFYDAPVDGTVFIDTDGSTFDTVLAVYTGPGDSFATLVEVACDNNSGSNGRTSRVSFQATAGTIYWVAVDGVNAATGIVNLNYAVLPPVVPSSLAVGANGAFLVTFTVAPEIPFVIERTTNYVGWIPVHTNITLLGVTTYQYTDTTVKNVTNAAYRLIQSP